MINITFIVPYPELALEVDNVFQKHPLRSRINKHVHILFASQLDERLADIIRESDVLIARGYTAQRLSEMKGGLPVVKLPITAYDIMRAINRCVSLYQPQHIAFIGNSISAAEAEAIGSRYPCRFSAYHASSMAEIELQMACARKDGCDALIGGYSVNLCAKGLGLHVVTVQTGESAIRQALDEAIRTVEVMRQERERTVLYSTITNSAKDGILYVANDLVIRVANPLCARYCHDPRELVGRSLAAVFPFMTAPAAEVLANGRECENLMHDHEGTPLSINYFPVIVNERVTGVVITFQDITKIQRLETQIRQKLSEKGLTARYRFGDIIHASPVIDQLIEAARRYAQAASNVLIVGETGTGKELLAQSLHNASQRRTGPFVAVNCAAIPENLLESEMFGYVEGAFTGSARGGKTGLFELAHNGTLFLDEISELPLGFQSKLLRVLQEREVRPVGADRVKTVDVRIIAAANCDLIGRVKQGLFRQDLYYRLVVLKLHIPPLRHRPEDVDVLFLHFMKAHSGNQIHDLAQIEPAALRLLHAHDFAGNIREMRNIAERVSIQCLNAAVVTLQDMEAALDVEGQSIGNPDAGRPTAHAKGNRSASERERPQAGRPQGGRHFREMVADSERELIVDVLNRCDHNQTMAAQELGMDRTTLWRKMNKHGISSTDARHRNGL